PPPTVPPLPYTTLFRSVHAAHRRPPHRRPPRPVGDGPRVRAPRRGRAALARHASRRSPPRDSRALAHVRTGGLHPGPPDGGAGVDRKSTRLNSSHVSIS